MDNIIDFLTSTEIIVVYIVALVAILLCIIIYLFDKSSDKRKQKQNTKELKKLVETIDDEEEEKIEIKEPVIEEVPKYQATPIILEKDVVSIEEEKDLVPEITETVPQIKEMTLDELKEEELSITAKIATINENEVTYTSNEPSVEDAKDEISRITEMLENEANKEEEMVETTVHDYEENQEKNAIISMDELIEKTKELAINKERIEEEEKTAPISLDEFEKTIIAEPTPSPLTEAINEVTNPQPEPMIMSSEEELNINELRQDLSVTENIQRDKMAFASRFKTSPVISPIYGVEEETKDTLELENTANYEKLDAEIKKTNEFLTKLKELQKKLD